MPGTPNSFDAETFGAAFLALLGREETYSFLVSTLFKTPVQQGNPATFAEALYQAQQHLPLNNGIRQEITDLQEALRGLDNPNYNTSLRQQAKSEARATSWAEGEEASRILRRQAKALAGAAGILVNAADYLSRKAFHESDVAALEIADKLSAALANNGIEAGLRAVGSIGQAQLRQLTVVQR